MRTQIQTQISRIGPLPSIPRLSEYSILLLPAAMFARLGGPICPNLPITITNFVLLVLIHPPGKIFGRESFFRVDAVLAPRCVEIVVGIKANIVTVVTSID